MKMCFLAILFFSSSLVLVSQNMFYDSRTLSESNFLDEHIYVILAKYLSYEEIQNEENLTKAGLTELYNSNPFITTYLNQLKVSDAIEDSISSYLPIYESSTLESAPLLSTIGNLDVTNLADGFIKYAIQRTKEELYIAYFKDFQKQLQDPVLQTLFPAANGMLNTIHEDIYQYKLFLPSLINSFELDLKLMPSNVAQLIRQEGIINNIHDRELLIDALDMAQVLVKDISLSSALSIYSENNLNKLSQINFETSSLKDVQLAVNFRSLFGFSQIMAEAIRDPNNTSLFITPDVLQAMAVNEKWMNLFLGLLWQKTGDQMRIIIGESMEVLSLKSLIQKLQDSNAQQNYITALINALISTRIIKSIEHDLNEEKTKTEEFRDEHEITLQTYLHIQQSGKFMNQISSSILPEKLNHEFSSWSLPISVASNLVTDVKRKNYPQAIIHSMQLLDQVIDKLNLPEELLQIGTFIASMAQAQSSDQIAAIIEAYALPTGSYSIKRNSSFNMALNSFMGLSGGGDILTRTISADQDRAAWTAGLSAPIGLAFSWGTKNDQSFSLYTQAIRFRCCCCVSLWR